MPGNSSNRQNETPDPSDDYAVLGTYRTAREAHEAGLSILAAGRHYWVHASEGQFLLIVRKRFEPELRQEIEIADFFNRFWPPRPLELPVKSVSKLPTVTFVLIIVILFWLQNKYPEVTELGINGANEVLTKAEWWRIVTAITLHADIGHLAGNILGLSLFGYLSARYCGNGLSWLLIIAAATCSNLTSIFTNDAETYRSLGASTAVFVALGMLAGFPIGAFIRSRNPLQTRDWLIPFSGGCVLFAWMGGGEFPTDVGAHLWSFAFGTLFAICVASLAIQQRLQRKGQRVMLALAAAIPALAWLWALSA